ncbi:MAG: hypothetical protein IPP51_07700 [Bacteroidetes bacterium]|nr:hypothetical protein [Bacteroidota bacterium]
MRITNALAKSTISGNVIKNMQRSGTSSSSFTGIVVQSGPADIINNTVGDPLVPNDLTFGANADIQFQGITTSTSQNLFPISISGNSINNVSMQIPNGNNAFFSGYIYTNNTTVNGSATISNNTLQGIVNLTANANLHAGFRSGEMQIAPITISNNKFENITLSNSALFKGIHCDRGNVIVSGNRIGSFTNPNSISIASTNIHFGIVTSFILNGNCQISNDTISNIIVTNPDATTRISGNSAATLMDQLSIK